MTTHSSRLRSLPLATALAALCLPAASALPVAHAATLATHPQSKSISVSNCNDSGDGSLRDAVGKALSDDTIDLNSLACSRISLTTGALTLPQTNLKIVGPGRSRLAIDGRNASQIVDHTGTGNLRISGISFVNGNSSGSVGLISGGCVRSDGNLRLDDVVVSHCKVASGADNPAVGGGLWVHGYAALMHSVISESSAVANYGGIAEAGGVYAAGNFYMRGSTITNNVAASALGPAYSNSGGVLVRQIAHISESLISQNRAGYNGGLSLNGTARITNSTVSGNTAVAIGGISATAPLYLYNSTVAFNNASRWDSVLGNGIYLAAGVFATQGGILSSTIISNNVNTAAPHPTADLTGLTAFTGESNNVMFCGTLCPADTTTESPGLHPLQDNGGPTKTHAPSPGPWNINHGNNRRAELWDQRGVGFPRMPPPDPIEIGAYQTNSGIIFVNGFN